VALVDGRTHELVRAADVALTKPGTVTLEVALLATPQVVTARVPAASAFAMRRLVKLEYWAMPSLILGQAVVPELLQEDAHPQRLAEALRALLSGPARAQQLAALVGVRDAPAGWRRRAPPRSRTKCSRPGDACRAKVFGAEQSRRAADGRRARRWHRTAARARLLLRELARRARRAPRRASCGERLAPDLVARRETARSAGDAVAGSRWRCGQAPARLTRSFVGPVRSPVVRLACARRRLSRLCWSRRL
jgi:hypothetical protein